jgi:hypothetical protein
VLSQWTNCSSALVNRVIGSALRMEDPSSKQIIFMQRG